MLRITYFSDYKKEASERNIEPVGIFFSKTNWYLTAYCQTKEEYRTFKVARIESLETTNATFTTQHPPLKNFLQEVRKTDKLEEIIITIPKDKISMLNDDKYYYGLFAEREVSDRLELGFLTFSLDKFARWYLSFADIATIINPDKLKEKILQIMKSISL